MNQRFNQSLLNDFENQINYIHHLYDEHYSHNLKIVLYLPLFETIFSSDNQNIIEAYTTEISSDFINSIISSSLEGFKPDVLNNLKNVINKLSKLHYITENNYKVLDAMIKISHWKHTLNLLLEGKDVGTFDRNIFIPLLEKFGHNETVLGLLESVTVKINKHNEADNFLIIPSEKELEKLFDQQIKTSWLNAKQYIKNFNLESDQFHEVIIYFNHRMGFYYGNSLGTALTIKFIEELLKYYNAKYLVEAIDGIAITGSLSEKGDILSIGENNIKLKTELIFYSNINLFVIPKDDEIAATRKLEELKQEYPNRKLKIIAVEDLDDLLNRRNIISIKKQNPVIRAKNLAQKNISTLLVILILTSLLTILLTIDFDDNPTFITLDGHNAYIKNKNGKILWSIEYPINIRNNKKLKYALFNIIDINNDGENEIIYVIPYETNKNRKNNQGTILCVNKKNNVIWSYEFVDTVSSEREELPSYYNVFLSDTTMYNGRKVMFFWANNVPSFSSAISAIHLSNGTRISETFWSAGHTSSVLLKDLDSDNLKEIIALGTDNGYEDIVFFSFKVNDLDGYRFTEQSYIIINKKAVKLLCYLRFPKTDYEKMMGFRFSRLENNNLEYNEQNDNFIFNIFSYKTQMSYSDAFSYAIYTVNSNFKDLDVFITDQFRIIRDSLVANGKLTTPYTDTKEYREILKNNILFWNGKKWSNRDKLSLSTD